MGERKKERPVYVSTNEREIEVGTDIRRTPERSSSIDMSNILTLGQFVEEKYLMRVHTETLPRSRLIMLEIKIN